VIVSFASGGKPFETIGDGNGRVAGRIGAGELQEHQAGGQRKEPHLCRAALPASAGDWHEQRPSHSYRLRRRDGRRAEGRRRAWHSGIQHPAAHEVDGSGSQLPEGADQGAQHRRRHRHAAGEREERGYLRSGQAYTVPYPYYNSFYGYYGAIYPRVYSPDYLREDRTVRVETSLYGTTTPQGDLVWTGISETFNPDPKKMDKAIGAVVQVVVQELKKEGIF
jgi:hypothetical protein